jgi:hypothetical protein
VYMTRRTLSKKKKKKYKEKNKTTNIRVFTFAGNVVVKDDKSGYFFCLRSPEAELVAAGAHKVGKIQAAEMTGKLKHVLEKKRRE